MCDGAVSAFCSCLCSAGANCSCGGESSGAGNRLNVGAWFCVAEFRGGVLVISAYDTGVVFGSFSGDVLRLVSWSGGSRGVFVLLFWWSGVRFREALMPCGGAAAVCG